MHVQAGRRTEAQQCLGGIALDSTNDLVVCDQGQNTVDVVAPPYTSVTRTIGSGFVTPGNVKLSKDNKLAFVTDSGTGTVTVVNYQTGANVTVLGHPNGISFAVDAVDGPNAVY